MIEDHLELYEMIREALAKKFPSETDNDDLALTLDKVAEVATLGALDYVNELEEAVANLRATIKRLS
jgi:uncharacterized small protein (DUF1192 family)